MVTLSLVVALIMANNYKVDVNQERYKLTKDYTEAKDAEYTFNYKEGKALYEGMCSRCHGERGEGALTAPPLKNALILNDNIKTLKVVIHGLNGEIKREGKTFNTLMPAFKVVKHTDLADVTNYIRKEFSETQEIITPMKVIEAKIDFISRDKPWTEKEL